jgi:hypothetical protein
VKTRGSGVARTGVAVGATVGLIAVGAATTLGWTAAGEGGLDVFVVPHAARAMHSDTRRPGPIEPLGDR